MATVDETLHDIYEPLPTRRRLRLVNLVRFHDERVCGLETFEIGESPAFSTLSYTWGPPLNTKECEEDYTRDSYQTITLITS
jgi:hypothetical protein